jgi:hypothetical protein
MCPTKFDEVKNIKKSKKRKLNGFDENVFIKTLGKREVWSTGLQGPGSGNEEARLQCTGGETRRLHRFTFPVHRFSSG